MLVNQFRVAVVLLLVAALVSTRGARAAEVAPSKVAEAEARLKHDVYFLA